MKTHYVADLQEGQLFTTLFLVREKEIRTSLRTGSSWLQLELSDRTGTISAKMWDQFAAVEKTFERDDVVQVRARVKIYNLGDFLPHTKCDVEQLYRDLRAAIAAMKNPALKRLLSSVVDDPAIAPKLKRAPAAMTMHHAFIGGLLEHMVSLIGLGRAVAAHYPELDADLLLAGIVLHDIGKIDELRYARGISYSTEGRLLGHIMIGVSLVREKIRAIPDFPAPLAVLVEHMILSHHGTREFGSPALPQTREAVALHFLDDMDSKMAAMRATLDSPAGEDEWTERNPSLGRALLRADKFQAGPDVKQAAAASAPKQAQRKV
jgi:3'-5' exoribonuclease